jgi:hypothetical protein
LPRLTRAAPAAAPLQAGATNGNPSDLEPTPAPKSSFQGTGRTLSGAAAPPQAPPAPAPPAPVTHTITFYTNGAWRGC